MRLNGKVAIVTGGASIIGSDIVRRFVREGARVISVDRDTTANQALAKEIREQGGACEDAAIDPTSSPDVVALFQSAGPVDILVNAAASSDNDGVLAELSEQTWDDIIDTCLTSAFVFSRAAVASMVPCGSGVIIHIAWANALAGIDRTAYTAAMGGLVSFARILAAQYGVSGIRSNTVCPGLIGDHGQPADVSSAVVFLASDQATFINGASMPIDGGLTATRSLPLSE